MEPVISKTEISTSELKVDMENDKTLGVTNKYWLCPECNKHILFGMVGVINVTPNGFNKNFQIGLAKINILTILFKKLNLMLRIFMKF